MQHRRLTTLLEMIAVQGHVTVAEVTERLGVSRATARRDLDSLAEQRLVMRTHGGASALASGYELPLQYKTALRADAKEAIAVAAAGLVSMGDVIALNGGTTTTAVARRLARQAHLMPSDGTPGLTVVTNALNIAYELTVRPQIRLVVAGGLVHAKSYETAGPLARRALAEVVLDVAVLGVDGVSSRFGVTTADPGEAEIAQDLAGAAKTVVLVADASKIGAASFSRVFGLETVDILVTDAEPPAEEAASLAEAGVRVIVGPASP